MRCKFQHVKIANKEFQTIWLLTVNQGCWVHTGYKALIISSPSNLAKKYLGEVCRYLHTNISMSKGIAILRDYCITSFFLQCSSSDQQSSLKGLPLGQLGLLNTAAIDDTTTTRLTFAS